MKHQPANVNGIHPVTPINNSETPVTPPAASAPQGLKPTPSAMAQILYPTDPGLRGRKLVKET